MGYDIPKGFTHPDTECSRTSQLKCPHCGGALDQMGYMEGPMLPGQREWVGENIYRCKMCQYGKNRFILTGAGLRQETAKVNAHRGVDAVVRGAETAAAGQVTS